MRTKAEIRLLDGELTRLAAGLALRQTAPLQYAIDIDGGRIPSVAKRRVVGNALRSLLVAPILPVIFRMLFPVIDGFCCTLPFLEEIHVAPRCGVCIIRAAGRAVHIVCAFFGKILPVIGIGAVAVLICLADEKAVGVSAANLFE